MKILCAASLALAFTCVISKPSVQAAVLAYDGFAAGGNAPSSSQYYTGTTYPNNVLAFHDPSLSTGPKAGGQSPNTLGFSGAWSAPISGIGQTSSSVAFKTQDASLNYTDAAGNHLSTTAGSVISGRSNSGTSYKTVGRALDFTSSASTHYISTLVSFNAGQMIEFDFRHAGVNSKPYFGFGIDSSGQAYIQLSPTTSTNSYLEEHTKVQFAPGTLAADTTHLLVLEVSATPNAALTDRLRLFINPLLDQPLTDSVATFTGDFYVPNNSDYAWSNMHITTLPNSGFVTFDEISISESWMGAVPEPTQTALLMTAAIAFCLRRKRKKSA